MRHGMPDAEINGYMIELKGAVLIAFLIVTLPRIHGGKGCGVQEEQQRGYFLNYCTFRGR
jgi:hypothetical protein